MDNKTLFGMLAGISFFAILFTEQGTDTWKLFGLVGLIFGIFWFKGK
jgi:hypothetical protein